MEIPLKSQMGFQMDIDSAPHHIPETRDDFPDDADDFRGDPDDVEMRSG